MGGGISYIFNRCKRASNKYLKPLQACVLEVDLENSEELCELYNGYALAPNKTENKRKMLSKYQLMIADLYAVHGKI